MSRHAPLGSHWLADLFGVRSELLTDSDALERLLKSAAKAAGATVVFSRFHSFGDAMGVTGVVLLAESHLSVHTWPESNFAAADVFMCGATEPELALAVLIEALQPESHQVRTLDRGLSVQEGDGDQRARVKAA